MTDVASFSHHLPPLLRKGAAPPAMSTRSRDAGLPRPLPPAPGVASPSDHTAPSSSSGSASRAGAPVTRKRAASINTSEANNSRLEDLSLHTPPAGSPRSADGSRDLICLCTPAPKVPRPRNAFILYRQHHQAQVVAQHPGLANPEISKIIGEQWRDQPEEVKNSWKRLAEEEKARHQRQYPDYRYQPRRGGKGGPAARPTTSSGEDPGRCQKCGGRYIATPRTPSAPFGAATPTLKQASSGMPPYLTPNPNPRGADTGHFRQHYSGDAPMAGDPHGRPPYPPRHPSVHEFDDEYDMMSPSDAKRRRYHGPAHYQPVSSPVLFAGHQPSRHVSRPSLGGPPPLSASGYGPGSGPLPGPSMIGRPGPGPMPPPPRPSVPYHQGPPPPPPRGAGFDESLRLPPLQTQLPPSPTGASDASGPSASAAAGLVGLGIATGLPPPQQSLRESQARSIEAMVMSIPYLNKLKVLGKISPPLAPPGPSSPAAETRGPVIAVEGAVPRLLSAVGRVVERTIAASGECALRVWSGGGAGEAAAPAQVRGSSGEAGEEAAAPPGGAAAPAAEGGGAERDESRSASLSGAGGGRDAFQPYLRAIMEWHARSDEIVKHVTTEPRPAASHAQQQQQQQDPRQPGPSSSAEDAPGSPRRGSSDSPSGAKPPRQLPVALIPDGFSLTLSDRFACRVPIADSYAPVDHWQWMATLWRGIVGPDLVVHVRPAAEDEVARLGAVDFKTPGVMVVRVGEGGGAGALDEKTERRLAFEVMEWVRSGSFRQGGGGGFARD